MFAWVRWRRAQEGVIREEAMYTNILIPTDGSELAGKAIQHGIALAKRIGAKVTALTVLQPLHVFTTNTQIIEDTRAQYEMSVVRVFETTSRVK